MEVWAPQLRARLHELLQQLAGVSFQTMLAVHALLVLSACALAFSRKRWQTALAWIAVLGFGLIWFGVSMLMLWLTDLLVSGFEIHGFMSLVWATIIVWAVNVVLDFVPGPWRGTRRD